MNKCPHCNSTRYTETISVEEGIYWVKRNCKKCGFQNRKPVINLK